ncbi:hypothetical protein [Cellulomonas sp. ICMP 17802]|uniref:hypothetical protein n=1 Tax=Cellulomonas sp. ICMP 17802 TaxID=3239199 RepID=UPI00351ACDF7
MSGSTPQPLGPAPGDDPQAGPPGRSRRAWWWLLVAVLALGLITALVTRPWEPVETEPTPTVTVTVPPTTEPGSPSASTSVAPPGADAVFDPTTALPLFVTPEDLVAQVPAAKPGVQQLMPSGQLTWGLPAGSTVEPATCTTAVTVVETAPPWFDAREWGNDAFVLQQEIVLLPDPAAARDAFRTLVTTVDACPEYRQVNTGVDGATWTAQPAIEGQGLYPSIVQEVTHAAEGTSAPSYRGHMLVGNAIVTWTAESLATGDPDAALATLGDPTSLDAMVQERAQAAVKALG